MTFRCPARTGLDGKARAAAETIGSPRPDIEWSPYDVFQCLLEDVPHHFHAAFLRTGARADPESDVYLCWRDESPVQWLADIDVCLKKPAPLGTGCTLYRGHPGRCEWQYIDPPYVAAQALVGQPANAWDPYRLFKSRK
ncbi:hypothetical protein [Streptomyces eurythermus]|uniref:hypothetical protein n=1 Tax=Streptomyces eurythermus TaxID=42237 RepID=UPI0033CE416A